MTYLYKNNFMKKIKLTESELIKLIRRIIIESEEELSIDDWEDIWFKLRKQSKSFGVPSNNIFPFGGLFFNYSKNGHLHLPKQKLSDWRDDLGKAADILDDYVDRLKNHFEESNLGLKLEIGEDYSMKIIKQLTESKYNNVRPLLEYDYTDEKTIDLVYKCAKVPKGMINQVHEDISPFLNQVLLACNHFTANNLNWYEESFVPALENVTKNKADFDKTQNILRCLLPKKGIQIEENNPILTICRKMFTTNFFGKRVSDIGEGTNINRAQIALAKLGIKSKILEN